MNMSPVKLGQGARKHYIPHQQRVQSLAPRLKEGETDQRASRAFILTGTTAGGGLHGDSRIQ